jgi:hypothetical protein
VPTVTHEALADLFKSRPSLAAEILVEALGVPLPEYTEAQAVAADLTEVQPAEYRADVVVVLRKNGVAVWVIVVEVQLATSLRKRLTWPAYVAVSRAIHNCPAVLLVVAPDPAVAAWCAEPIETGSPGFVLRPFVLSPTAVPVVTDPDEAARRLELAALSAMAHGKSEQGAAIAAAVLPAIHRLDPLENDRAGLYSDLVYHSLNEAARHALEETMKGYEYQSDFAKRYFAQGRAEGHTEGLTEGLTKGLTEGITKGLTEGITKGRTEGRTEEAARAVLTVLRARGLAVPDSARERILAQNDPERLERWLEKAAVVSSAAAVFDEPN